MSATSISLVKWVILSSFSMWRWSSSTNMNIYKLVWATLLTKTKLPNDTILRLPSSSRLHHPNIITYQCVFLHFSLKLLYWMFDISISHAWLESCQFSSFGPTVPTLQLRLACSSRLRWNIDVPRPLVYLCNGLKVVGQFHIFLLSSFGVLDSTFLPA